MSRSRWWLGRVTAVCALLALSKVVHAQTDAAAGADYTNPILFSDYSDPDVIRDGKQFYMVSSTFSFVPGLPILSSPDLVHWHVLTHAVKRIDLAPEYDLDKGNRYGRGIWAPALRKHAGRFYLFFPTPDEGIFMVSAPHMGGPWTKPVAVLAGPNLEDPCPFWDSDGKAYLVHSRTGAGPLILHRMSADATHVLDAGKEIVNDPVHLHTLEGPKLYKRNGWYYIFAPFGGVSTGKQVTLRSRNIYGPYESQVSLEQGTSAINGPHQGGWVTTPDGRDYFLHFQSRGAHGRIDHLEPMRWKNDWPVMGTAALDPNAPEPGQPVERAPMPVVVDAQQFQPRQNCDPKLSFYCDSNYRIRTSDEFVPWSRVYQQWEWNHNPVDSAWSLTERPGFLRLHALPATGLFDARNTRTQQMQSESLTFTARMELTGLRPGSHAGLTMFEQKASGIDVMPAADGQYRLAYFHTARAKDGAVSDIAAASAEDHLQGTAVLLRAAVHGDTVQYSFSSDEGKTFQELGPETAIDFSWWKGARPALFHYTDAEHSTSGAYLDVDWVHVEALP